jgi:hypothetical protein
MEDAKTMTDATAQRPEHSTAFIDWLSFTIKKPTMHRTQYHRAFREWLEASPIKLQAIYGHGAWQQGRGRSPYAISWELNGCTVFDGPNSDHMLVELSGRGCDLAGRAIFAILKQVRAYVTRIDIACDFDALPSPETLLSQVETGRIKSRSLITSATGETAYIGSRKSNQIVRIYRYNPPHPRSHLTRVEYMGRKGWAKLATQKILSDGIDSVYESICDRFKLPNVVHMSNTQPSDMRLEYGKQSESKTLMWLISTCVPALRRLADNGTIDLDTFIAQHLR